MATIAEVLKNEKTRLDNRSVQCANGRHSYAHALNESGAISAVDEHLRRGSSLRSVFLLLRKEGTFDGDDYVAFYRAYQRRKGNKGKKKDASVDTLIPARTTTSATATGKSTDSSSAKIFGNPGQKLSAAEVIIDNGKKYSLFGDQKIELQPGKLLDQRSGLQLDKTEFAIGYYETEAIKDDKFKKNYRVEGKKNEQ